MKVEDITKKREGIHKVLDITMSKEEATLLDEFWALIPKQFSSGKDLPKGFRQGMSFMQYFLNY